MDRVRTRPLRREDEKKIELNRPSIERDFDPKYHMGLFIEKGIIDSNDREEIKSLTRQDDRAAKFLTFLQDKGGPDGFSIFIDHLRDNGYGDLANQVEKTDVTALDPWQWYDRIDERIKQHVINDADASRFSFCVGKGWDDWLLQIGLRQTEIDMEKDTHQNRPQNIRNLLIKWGHKMSREATVQALVDKMRKLDRDLVIDMEKFQEVLTKIKI